MRILRMGKVGRPLTSSRVMHFRKYAPTCDQRAIVGHCTLVSGNGLFVQAAIAKAMTPLLPRPTIAGVNRNQTIQCLKGRGHLALHSLRDGQSVHRINTIGRSF